MRLKKTKGEIIKDLELSNLSIDDLQQNIMALFNPCKQPHPVRKGLVAWPSALSCKLMNIETEGVNRKIDVQLQVNNILKG